jgi:ABC-type glutathione transport system ATPase component
MIEALEISALYPTPHGAVEALRGVSLRLAPREAVALVGRSGCGKTTLGRLMAGLPPAGARLHGTLRWPGGEAAPGAARRKGLGRHVAWVPQEGVAALHPQLSIGAQIAETLRAAGQRPDAAAIDASLGEVELDPHLASSLPHQISGGQGQRAALACALAQAPALLVADEPTSALDQASAAAILRLLDACRRERGMAMMLITHDLHAAALCDRIVVMEEGRIAEDGPADVVLKAPASPIARALLAARDRIDRQAGCFVRAA